MFIVELSCIPKECIRLVYCYWWTKEHFNKKNACRADVKILPYLDIETMDKHLAKFMKILQSTTQLKLADIPIIAALDATAVAGRLFTRAADKEDEELRYL